MLCKRHLGFQEGKHVQNEKALLSIWDRKKPWWRGQKRSEQRGVVSERKDEDDFSWSINSTWSKKLKRRRRVLQAARDDSKDSDEGDRRRPVRAKEEDRMPSMTMKTLRRFIEIDEILMTATVTARAVGNVEGPDDSSPTDFSFTSSYGSFLFHKFHVT